MKLSSRFLTLMTYIRGSQRITNSGAREIAPRMIAHAGNVGDLHLSLSTVKSLPSNLNTLSQKYPIPSNDTVEQNKVTDSEALTNHMQRK